MLPYLLRSLGIHVVQYGTKLLGGEIILRDNKSKLRTDKAYSALLSCNRDGKLIKHSMKKITFLLSMIMCFLMYGCNETPEYLSLEGKGHNWAVFARIPYTSENNDKYIKVTFICSFVENLFSESDIISFGIGTSVDTVVYSYSKTNGYIRSEHSHDPIDLERIIRVSDDTFEVFYDINIIDTSSKKVSDQLIVIKVTDEKIKLLPVE